MLKRLFPGQIDNAYRGHVLAIWLFAPVLALKTAMGFNVSGANPFLSSRWVLINADGVPVDSYPVEAGAYLVFMFAAWGLALFIQTLLGWIVLLRYRAMTPLMILAFTFEQVARIAQSTLMLPHRAAAQDQIPISALINWGLAVALVLALALSLLSTRPRSPSG